MHMGSGSGDLTIGDFWNIYNKGRVTDTNYRPTKGTNIVYIHTKKGQIAFNAIKNSISSIKI